MKRALRFLVVIGRVDIVVHQAGVVLALPIDLRQQFPQRGGVYAIHMNILVHGESAEYLGAGSRYVASPLGLR